MKVKKSELFQNIALPMKTYLFNVKYDKSVKIFLKN